MVLLIAQRKLMNGFFSCLQSLVGHLHPTALGYIRTSFNQKMASTNENWSASRVLYNHEPMGFLNLTG